MDIIDANGCVLSTSETILEPANPVNITSSVNDVLCYGDFSGEINTQVSGGTGPYTYAWSTISTWNNVPYAIPFPTNANVGSPIPPFGLPAGTYMVTVTDANGVQRQVTIAGGPVMIEALGANGATRLQTMIGNGITSIVQNAADGQQVQRFATVTVDVAGMRNMLSQLGQNRVMENALGAHRAVPR